MIHFDQVSKRYDGGFEALSSVSCSIEKGEMVFLTGHSGAGKSTFLNLLTAIEKPSSGQIRVDGQQLNTLTKRDIAFYRRKVGIVHQDHQLIMDQSVFNNVAQPLLIAGEAPNEVKRRVRAALDKVGLLSKEKFNPVQLSGGEQQRVGIARAVVKKPDLILADEPTGNLDPELSRDIMNLFRQFNEVGTTVLIASHDLGLIARLDYRVLSLNQGKLLASPFQ
ncbi:cell division ATP-binding protein FtsE [Reinekea marina]|uniref:Cell division ATP-binding protein FtsE n=1 Tax=Reinekea marina TaxID=1310421 RepID=A0ABV7WNV4_9GAMM|nr:cell division ATP-binding protein FtsE [Reinekea marina]MBU2865051.1 cell division ATP-binding protein FtsE [Reinekea forsetii]MDN3648324.1 cell division ATP-binding protein FtsE [Reinekea marina]